MDQNGGPYACMANSFMTKKPRIYNGQRTAGV